MSCLRIKKIHLKILSIIFSLLIFYFIYQLLAVKENAIAVVNGSGKLVSQQQVEYEKKLRDYESKIIPNLGDNGDPAYLEGKDAQDEEEALKTFALNTVLSDRMPLNRKLRDPRNKK